MGSSSSDSIYWINWTKLTWRSIAFCGWLAVGLMRGEWNETSAPCWNWELYLSPCWLLGAALGPSRSLLSFCNTPHVIYELTVINRKKVFTRQNRYLLVSYMLQMKLRSDAVSIPKIVMIHAYGTTHTQLCQVIENIIFQILIFKIVHSNWSNSRKIMTYSYRGC